MEPLRESEQQLQNPTDSQFHHNFQNQLPYSTFQEEPIAKSMEDMIQIQNFVTLPISRLDSIMSELINENEKIFSCQPLTKLISLTILIGPKNHVILETKIQF